MQSVQAKSTNVVQAKTKRNETFVFQIFVFLFLSAGAFICTLVGLKQ